MSFDERLERLADRHEALTQSVELLAHQSRAQDMRIDKILAAIEKDSQNISALARIAESHRRLTDLGG